MKKTLIYIAVLAMLLALVTVPVFAEEVPCTECGSIECCCPTFPCYGDPATPGYWKNHYEQWEGMTGLPLGYSSGEWLDILNTPSSKGPWYQLAKQYIAAWLNLNVGDVDYEPEYGADVYDALNRAAFLLDVELDDRGTIDRQNALKLKDFLDIFNNYDRTE